MGKFEIGDTIYCIKEFETLKLGSSYRIRGAGDLSMLRGSNKKGYGFSVEDDRPTWGNYKRKVKNSSIFYFFTENEINDHFLSSKEYHKIWNRDQKINCIING